jgi:hypothetical protein
LLCDPLQPTNHEHVPLAVALIAAQASMVPTVLQGELLV